MGLFIICGRCGHRNSLDAESCMGRYRSGLNKGSRCTVKNLKRSRDKSYGVDLRINGKRHREEVGPSRVIAEERLLELSILSEKPQISIKKKSGISIGYLLDWYSDLESFKSKASYRRGCVRIKSLRRILGNESLVSEITIRSLELYVSKRSSEDSPMKTGEKIAPKTVKEELNLLRSIINKAHDFGEIEEIPLKGHLYPKIEVDNIRQRIFTKSEIELILEISPIWMRNIILMAYMTGMRQREIIDLQWDSVDLKRGFIRLKASETKTRTARLVKLVPEVIETALIQHPSVASAAVVAVADRRLGQVPGAVVVLKSGGSHSSKDLLEDLETELRKRLPATHIPVHWRIVDALPKTPSVKVDVAALRGMFSYGHD